MEEAPKLPQGNNEIDLIDLFTKIGRGLRSAIIELYNFIVKTLTLVITLTIKWAGKGLVWFGRILSWNIRFIIRKSPWLILTALLTAGSVYYLHKKIAPKTQQTQGIFIKTRILPAQQIRPYFLSFNQLLSVGKFDYLSKATGVSIDSLKHIKSIEPHYLLDMDGDGIYDVVDFADEWRDLVKKDQFRMEQLLSDTTQGVPQPRVAIVQIGLYLEVQFNDTILSPRDFNPTPMLIKYLESLDEYSKALRLNFQFKTQSIARIDEEIAFEDTLRMSELRRRENEPNLNRTGSTKLSSNYEGKAAVIIDQGSGNSSEPQDNSLLTSKASLRLFDERQAILKDIYFSENPVIQTYSLTQKEIDAVGGYLYKKTSFKKTLIKLTLLASFCCYLLLIVLWFRKDIYKELSKGLDEI